MYDLSTGTPTGGLSFPGSSDPGWSAPLANGSQLVMTFARPNNTLVTLSLSGDGGKVDGIVNLSEWCALALARARRRGLRVARFAGLGSFTARHRARRSSGAMV